MPFYKKNPLAIYLILLSFLCTGFIISMKLLGQKGYFLAQFYMLSPAISAIITRLFFYDKKFKDANIRIGKIKYYLRYWIIASGITISSFIIYTLIGAISWDFTGHIFLNDLAKQFTSMGKDINTSLPNGFTPTLMLIIFFIGGLTIFNILPGVITGFGEEFGWRGFMFPQLYKIKPWVGFVVGGLIWFAWHIPLIFVIPQTTAFTITETILNTIALSVGSICSFTFLAYVYIKTENIFVASITHITLNNVARSFAYFAVIKNQFLANIGMLLAMLIVIAVLYYSKEFKVFEIYFKKPEHK